MAIDYYSSFPCKVREILSDADLLRMEKARNRATVVLDLMRNNPKVDKSKPESEWTFTTVVAGPNGPKETKARISDLLAEAAPLHELATNCSKCPFNVRSADFGCGGAVHYPITARAERWLLSRLPDDLKTPRGLLLTRAIADFNFDGSGIDAARGRICESSVPAERKWGSFFSRTIRITSSQILHMAFGVGSLQPAHARMVAYFVGFLNDDFSVKNDPENSRQPDDDDITVEMKYFFSAAALAGTNGVPMLVDA
jgi:hypothetical protein